MTDAAKTYHFIKFKLIKVTVYRSLKVLDKQELSAQKQCLGIQSKFFLEEETNCVTANNEWKPLQMQLHLIQFQVEFQRTILYGRKLF